ncbi:helix-turn-helix domain-containing protein [Streptomyces sp. NPDC001678]|uniref:helix-turn-helix domain-containing protein n=1 Tax=Streptomyces sp. NPDC001678 TaxID=3364599 RepID=UPI0036B3331C
MGAISAVPGPGMNVAVLRKQRGWGQHRLAQESGISASMLGKIERGERALTQGVAASIARAFALPLEEVLGQAPVPSEDSLKALNSAIRRFDLPREPDASRQELKAALTEMTKLRENAKLNEVLSKLPELVSGVTNFAHAAATPEGWAMVADAYSTVYWLAARHRWMMLADLAVTKQKLAAQQADPLAQAISARDEAGVYLNMGEFEDGLSVVDRAITLIESGAPEGPKRSYALGILHLRGMTLAGRLRHKTTADQHIARAWALSEEFNADVDRLGIHFGPQNTAVHVVATYGDLHRHAKAIETMEELTRNPQERPLKLPPTRTSPLRMNVARSKLALGDRDGALTELEVAWALAPQMARVHPTSQELLRVLTTMHKRSNPRLTRLARRANIRF